MLSSPVLLLPPFAGIAGVHRDGLFLRVIHLNVNVQPLAGVVLECVLCECCVCLVFALLVCV